PGPSEGVDSYSLLPALLGENEQAVREATVHHSVNGSFAIRKGPWKLILCPGSGGWSDPKPDAPEIGSLPPFQLYNLEKDIGETENLVDQYPEIADELSALLRQYIKEGRSTPGPVQAYVDSENWPGLSWMVD
ncbi:MAG: arylsulfatase, partial [Bacteroidales bacterium]|nr:arylsulfatase [Bacteroidales bacterium]